LPAELRSVILRAQDGDLVAFEELLSNFHNDVFALLCKWTGNWHDAEDLTQETFIKVFRYLKSFRIEENFRSWLYRIALRLAHDHYNKTRKLPRHESLDSVIFQNLQLHSRNPSEEELQQKQTLKAIYNVLPTLSFRERSVFVLKAMQGMENQEISRILGISQTTVRRFFGLARQKILKRLEQKDNSAGMC
jgi:RNA polymerase sigma-70 factor, ECF subfamily